MSKRNMFVTAALLVMLLLAIPTLAGNNDADPECTKTQLLKIATTIEDAGFTDQYKSIANTLGFITDDNATHELPGIVESLSDLQLSWWSDIVPEFPACAMASKMALLGGRTMDEFTISISIVLNSYLATETKRKASGDLLMDRFNDHKSEWEKVQADFVALTQELREEMNK